MLKQSELNDFAPILEGEDGGGDDDFNSMAIRRRRLTPYEQWQKWFSNIPVGGYVINGIANFIRERMQQVSRRRRSYKLSLFFQGHLLASLVGFGVFFFSALTYLGHLRNVYELPAECTLPSTYLLTDGSSVNTYESDGVIDVNALFSYTVGNRESVSCTNDSLSALDAACTLSEYQLLVYIMLVEGIVFLLSAVICLLIYMSFKFFSNIPMESFENVTTSCKVSFYGAMARHGPWLSRFLTVINLALVLALVLMTLVGRYCYGAVSETASCASMYDDCFSIQYANCRYYYSSNCMGDNLPHTTANLASVRSYMQECKNPVFSSKFSGRIDARLVYPTVCTRCWALHADCYDPQVNRMAMTNDKSSSSFVYKTEKFHVSPAVDTSNDDLVRNLYCRCLMGSDMLGSATADPRIDYFNSTLLLGVDRNASTWNCPSVYNSTPSACPATLTVPFEAPGIDANATVYSPNWSGYVFNTTATQECIWGPSDVASFYYDSAECIQNGSSIYRYIFITSYVMLTILGILIIIGVSLRNTVQPETWSYSPQDPHEAWYWRILRSIGPG